MSNIFMNINELSFTNKERTELRIFFAYNDATKVEEILSTITEEVEKVEFLRIYVSKSREESRKLYIASDRHSIELPSQIINILNSGEFEPKHFALGYQGRKLCITNQMIDMWSLLSKDDGNSIKRVLLGPMGVKKSYLALFLAAKAYSKGWLILYISDVAELIKPTMEMVSKEICKRFLAINKDILIANELKKLVEFVSEDDVFVTYASLIWDLLKQKDCKTLLVVDEHGVLFDLDPPVPDRLIILISLKNLNFWEEKAAESRVIFTSTAHAKFEKTYLINEEAFDKLLNLHPFLKKPSIATKVKRIVNCVPRELIYFAKYVKDSFRNYIPDERIDILLESFQNDRHDEFLKAARIYFSTLDHGSRMDYCRSLSNMFLRSSDMKLNFKPLCLAASDALLDIYRTFPLPEDINVTSLKNGKLTDDNFEEILFQQLLNHRDVLFNATNLCREQVMNVHIKFQHFFVLEKNQLAPEPRLANSLIRGYARYPQFNFMIRYLFIQVSISPFDQHNKESANIDKAFERYCKEGNNSKN
ncbi:1075_t:CDS:2 [Funneliformis mosseae]|uniref:1075_t:CDS:1 n=1 Tax=Funneliformis mosseae TaxID=27381 RepID=A0A9N9A6B7_FUNMO|nr:1075_t:CDS:2 [Funneliformis mosseae]